MIPEPLGRAQNAGDGGAKVLAAIGLRSSVEPGHDYAERLTDG
jgi:hypothetical protein